MELGAFSVSLAVKNLAVSRSFYENLGFTAFAGDQDRHWLIVKNELPHFTDVRALHARLKARGVTLDREVEAETTGPASMVLTDPDGNVVLIDQHV